MRRGRRTLVALAGACSLAVVSAAVPSGCGGDDGAEPAGPPAGGGAAPAPAPPAPEAPAPQAPDPSSAPAPGLLVWFKLDPRLTTGAYLGERWVAPATLQAAVQSAPEFTIEAKVEGVATWTPSDPEMVTAEPARARQVLVTVHRPGRSTIAVSDGAGSALVTVVAAHEGGAWYVELSQ